MGSAGERGETGLDGEIGEVGWLSKILPLRLSRLTNEETITIMPAVS